jgi:hypothetical protein
MGVDIIVIGIGEVPTRFSVHSNLICRTSEKLSALLRQPLPQGQELHVLQQEDPATFRLFVEYLYTRKIPGITMAMDRATQQIRTIQLCKLHCFFDRYDVKAVIMNQTLDCIQDSLATLDIFPNAELILNINRHSTVTSPLRKLMAHCMLFWLNSDDQMNNDTLVNLLRHRRFATGFIKALKAMNTEQYVMSADPRIRDCGRDEKCKECSGNLDRLHGKVGMRPCFFHIHSSETDGNSSESCYLFSP